MSVADVAERTSKTVGGDRDGGALFDETAGHYTRLRIRSEKIITDTLNNNVREALRPYRHMYVSQSRNLSVAPDIYLLFAVTPGPPLPVPQPQQTPVSRQLQSWIHSSHT